MTEPESPEPAKIRLSRLELAQAERSLRSCNLLLADGDASGAVNRLYYALYHRACAALINRGVSVPKSHSGLIAAFGANFVKSGEFSWHLGKLFSRVEHERLTADYTGEAVDTLALPALIAQGELFLSTIRRLL